MFVVKLLAFWYTTQTIRVRWGNSLSDPFRMMNGIRQGGILSPYLFNIVLDDLLKKLNESKVGCVAGGMLINHLAYADDTVLIAPSAKALQTLINICSHFAIEHDMIYNTEKN